MSGLKYRIEIRDSKGNLYKDINGSNVVVFNAESSYYADVNIIEGICKSLYKDYKAITKRGSQINIEVTHYNSISETYMTMYSYYNDKTFVGH